MKQIIAAVFCALLAVSVGAQITPERKEELKGQFAHPVSMDEADFYHDAGDGYEIAANPKISADGKRYYFLGYIELPHKSGTSFIARVKHGKGLDAQTIRAFEDIKRRTGSGLEPYFEVQIPKPLLQAYQANARMNMPIGIIGRYTGNTEIIMTTNKRVVIPVVEALALDFNGVYSSIPLPKPKPAPRPVQKQESQTVKVNEDDEVPDDSEPKLGQGPAFQCSKASKHVELMICADKELSRLDLWLYKVYTRARMEHPRSHDGDTGKSSFPLGDDQTRWRTKVRDACIDADCVMTAYQRRVIEIKRKFPYGS
jgi:hypothetical protein